MDYLTLLLLSSFLLACIHFFFSHGRKSSESINLPPGPPPYPIIGNLLELAKPHQALTHLPKTYGPIITLKLGNKTSILISSPDLAKEALHKNGLAFSGRSIPDSVKALDHHKVSITWLSPTSSQWKTLRKICAVNVFSPQQLDSTQVLRQRKVQELLEFVQQSCRNGEAIDVSLTVFTTALNSISNTLFSTDVGSYTSDLSKEFKNMTLDMAVQAGRPNIVNYFPGLRMFDPQGARRKMKNYYQKFLNVITGIIDERMKKGDFVEGSAVLSSLLNLVQRENSEFTYHDLLHFLMDLFIAGVDTTSSTVEWALAELLHSPEKMKKAKKELQQVLGKDGELPKESDISKFPYLQAVVKETFRLHPSPILIQKLEAADIDICGFRIPKDTEVLINVWGIGRDPSIWTNPNLFCPERFLESEIDFRGNDFELLPFGAGRRICPGLPLANRSVHTVLASLLYCFDWKLPDGQNPEDMDMTEVFGITPHRAQSLRAIPIKE